MKQLITLLVLLISLNIYSQDCNIGNEIATGDFGNGQFGVDNLLGVKYTLEQEGTLLSMNLIGNGTNAGVQMAVYNDNAGIPNDLVATSVIGTVTNGIISLPTTPTLLPAGDYWIMAVYGGGGNQSNVNISAGGNAVYYKSHTLGDDIPTNASNFSTYIGQDFLYFLEVECANTSSVDDLEMNQKISLYPNPATNEIEILSLVKAEYYEIFNTFGALVAEGNVKPNEKINIRNLENGIYFLQINATITLKFIVG